MFDIFPFSVTGVIIQSTTTQMTHRNIKLPMDSVTTQDR